MRLPLNHERGTVAVYGLDSVHPVWVTSEWKCGLVGSFRLRSHLVIELLLHKLWVPPRQRKLIREKINTKYDFRVCLGIV